MTGEVSLGSSSALDPLLWSVVRMYGTLKWNKKVVDDAAECTLNTCIIELHQSGSRIIFERKTRVNENRMTLSRLSQGIV